MNLVIHRGFVLYLAGLWRVEDVHSAGLDAVGLRPTVESKSAFPPTSISVGQRAIVPVIQTNTRRQREREKGGVRAVTLCFSITTTTDLIPD